MVGLSEMFNVSLKICICLEIFIYAFNLSLYYFICLLFLSKLHFCTYISYSVLCSFSNIVSLLPVSPGDVCLEIVVDLPLSPFSLYFDKWVYLHSVLSIFKSHF